MLHSFYEKLKKDTSFKTAVYIFLLALFIVSLFKNPVNRLIVYKLLPKEEVSIILDQPAELSLKSDDVRITLPVSVDKLLYETETEDGKYRAVFQMTRVPEQYILVGITEEIDSVSFRIGDNPEEEHTFTEEEKNTGTYKVFPFADSYLKLALSLMIYFGAGITAFCILLVIHVRLQERKLLGAKIWEAEYKHPYIWFFAVWAIIFGIGMWQYVFQVGTPHYIPDNALGDQSRYWNTYIFDGFFFDFNVDFPVYLGYSIFLPATLAKGFAHLTGLDPVKVYLLFPSFAISLLITLTAPRLYHYASNRPVRTISVVFFGLIVVYFWNSYVIGVLTDMYAAVLFLSVIACFVKIKRKKSILFSLLLGFAAGLMINIRLNYLYAIVFAALAILISRLYLAFHKHKAEEQETLQMNRKVKTDRKTAACVLLAVCAFLIVCIPQVVYNYKRGHLGLFPYDSATAYGGYPVIWSGWNTFLSRGMVLWPRFISDDQIISMKTQLYSDRLQVIHPAQAMDVYANSPIETVIVLFKKAFTIMDIKSNINYADRIDWRETSGMMFSFFNYLILLTGGYCLINDRSIPSKAKRVILLVFLGTFVPQLVAHCEWRNGLVMYLILYIAFAYDFVGSILADKGRYAEMCRDGFFRFLAFGELLCFGISMTLWA